MTKIPYIISFNCILFKITIIFNYVIAKKNMKNNYEMFNKKDNVYKIRSEY